MFINTLRLFIVFPLFFSCSGLEKTEKEKIREQNAKGEYIYRKANEVFYQVEAPKPCTREPYPWEETPQEKR
jgi:hypothetical protein